MVKKSLHVSNKFWKANCRQLLSEAIVTVSSVVNNEGINCHPT